MEDSSTECDLNCRYLDQEISEEKNVNMWPRNQSYDILVMNVAGFFFPLSKKSA